jgi:arsenite methyltransferase
MMNRRNAEENAFAVKQLEVAPSDRVLEIGFGGGVTLPSLMDKAAFVCGVDLSKDAVKWATSKFQDAVKAGRAEFREARVEALPFEPASFTKTCTVNTVYFWSSLDKGFAEIHRVLTSGGRLAVGFLPKEHMDRMGMPSDIFTSRSPEEVVSSLTTAGFKDVRIERPELNTAFNVIIATA